MISRLSSITNAASAVRFGIRGGEAAITVLPELCSDIIPELYWLKNASKPLRYFISGNIGSLIFFSIDRLIYLILCHFKQLPAILDNHKEGFSFFVSYLLQVVPQHWLHAVLVYGVDTISTRAKYFQTLLYQYSVYASSMFGSTFLNTMLVKAGLHRTIAFFGTIAAFSIINYFLIEWTVRRGLLAAEKSKTF
jgi:hypothetical protein